MLFYRLPGEGWAAGPDVALSDAQRAMRLIRHRARDYGIDPGARRAMGFSAGGHVCADLGTRFAASTYAPVDAADACPPGPFAAAPIYPVVSMTAPVAHAGSREQPDRRGRAAGARARAFAAPQRARQRAAASSSSMPRTTTSVPVENALLLRAALRAQGIPVETHLFPDGGHGFGLRQAVGKPVERLARAVPRLGARRRSGLTPDARLAARLDVGHPGEQLALPAPRIVLGARARRRRSSSPRSGRR